MQLLTPARLATLVGVLTGLSAAATALLDVFPKDTAVGRTVVAAVGVIGTIISIAKFLEGQAGWEQQAARHQHELKMQAVYDGRAAAVVARGKGVALPKNVSLPNPAHSTPAELPVKVADEAVLPGETPIDSVDAAGVVIEQEANNGEPQRLVDQGA